MIFPIYIFIFFSSANINSNTIGEMRWVKLFIYSILWS
jgi:hypothetical protein